jgi:transcription elongation GreA/GreB family factor
MKTYSAQCLAPKKKSNKQNTVKIGSKVKLRFTSDAKDYSTDYKVVQQTDTTDDSPQIESNSDLGKAIIGQVADPHSRIHYEDRHKGITGVFILEVK